MFAGAAPPCSGGIGRNPTPFSGSSAALQRSSETAIVAMASIVMLAGPGAQLRAAPARSQATEPPATAWAPSTTRSIPRSSAGKPAPPIQADHCRRRRRHCHRPLSLPRPPHI